jgi:putative transposase
VPTLADRGEYLASESTIYRIMKAAAQQHHRGRAKKPTTRVVTSHCATEPNRLWSWDITWLPTAVKGLYFYWYMVLDVYSRKIVGHEVHVAESAELAALLMRKASLVEGLAGRKVVLHSDNGSAMMGATMLATLERLGVVPSFSRPRVSNDNPFAESLSGPANTARTIRASHLKAWSRQGHGRISSCSGTTTSTSTPD